MEPFENRRRARDRSATPCCARRVQLFLEQGYHRITLNDDRRTRLNITKPALYNYFRSKEEILFECCRQGQDLYEANIAAIEDSGGDGWRNCASLIRAYANVIAERFRRLPRAARCPRIVAEAAPKSAARKRRINPAFREQIRQGSPTARSSRAIQS